MAITKITADFSAAGKTSLNVVVNAGGDISVHLLEGPNTEGPDEILKDLKDGEFDHLSGFPYSLMGLEPENEIIATWAADHPAAQVVYEAAA